jgi:hypothetical protein
MQSFQLARGGVSILEACADARYRSVVKVVQRLSTSSTNCSTGADQSPLIVPCHAIFNSLTFVLDRECHPRPCGMNPSLNAGHAQ